MEKKKNTLYSQTAIKYDQSEYIFKLYKPCKWCWFLLLLLLPILLLIPLKKDIRIKLVNANDSTVISNTKLNFEYVKRDLFNFETSKFFSRAVKPEPYLSDTTDSEGIAEFKNVKYTIYQWLFRNDDFGHAWVETDLCNSCDSNYNFFSLKVNKPRDLYFYTTVKDMEFTVVDIDDNNEPLNNAIVSITSTDSNYQKIDTTDAAGIVVFKQVPVCSNIKVIGSKYGWKNDTIPDREGEILTGHDTLFLEQEKVIVKFYVKDLLSRSPIVNAHGQLYFKDNPDVQIGTDAITNINGVGQGVFENVHLIKKMKININYNNDIESHYDTSSVENIGWISAEQWNQREDSDKVLFLRPKPLSLVFYNVDCITNNGISNIENLITIETSNSRRTYTNAYLSNSEGEFIVGNLYPGDKISIRSISKNICPNKYLPNDTSVVNLSYSDLKENPEKRVIYLCKEPSPTVKFRNVDEENPSVGVEGVINTISLNDGTRFVKTSGQDGWFEISEVYECQIISLSADGTNVEYGINNSKIHNLEYKKLVPPAPKEKRTIPLKKESECLTFRNIDRCTNLPLTGIVNDLVLQGINSGSYISGADGTFKICGNKHDRIKIIVNDPRYEIFENPLNGNQTIQELLNQARPIDIKLKMKGQIGKLNFRLIWDDNSDVDFRITDPKGHIIDSHSPNTQCPCGGKRDIDNTIGGIGSVENIFYDNPPTGQYKIEVQLHTKREPSVNYKIIVESDCITKVFSGTLTTQTDNNNQIFVGRIKFPLQ